MTLFSIALLSPSSWTVIGPPLANHLWQSTVFAGAVWLLTLLLRKNHAQSRYVLWLVASAKFLLPFSLLVALGSHLGWSRTAAAPQPRIFIAVESIGQPFDPAIPVPTPPHAAPGAFATIVRLLPASLLSLWTVGCVFVLFMWYLRWRRLTAIRRAASPSKSGRELEVLRRIERTARLPQQIDLVLSQSALEPGILGIFRPALLLPAGISEKLTDVQLESVIAHELCHVRRRDNLAAGFHMLVEALFWFHPLVWWMGARLVEERERACDEEVLRLGADPHVYAEGILKVCKFYLESPLSCAAGVTGSNLKKRIEAIMTNRITSKLELGKKLLLSTLGVAALVAPIAFGLLHVPQSNAEPQAQNASPDSLAFESGSVKPNINNTPMKGLSVKGKPFTVVLVKPDHFIANNVTLQGLIRTAYWVQDSQIVGGPQWINSEKYDVDATIGSPVVDQLGKLSKEEAGIVRGRMLQTLLADRFKLALHRETRELPVYTLAVAPGGPKLQLAKPGDTYADGPKGPQGRPIGQGFWELEKGRLVSQGQPLLPLVTDLAARLGHTVVDKTGLTGIYDFTLQWSTHEDQGADHSSSILAAIQDQLGLKLELQNNPVEVFVIDHAERVAGDESSQVQSHVQSIEQPELATAPVGQDGSLTCTFASVKYPEGTVIQEGNGPEQLCARVLDRGNPDKNGMLPRVPEWIHTDQSIRERSRNIVHLHVTPVAFCTPKPSTQSNLCSCEESGFFSENSDVDSAQGKLTCKKGKWVPLTVDHTKQAKNEEQTGTPRLN